MTDSRTRLHISPFAPSLLKSIIPPSLTPSASNISFHSIQTFPENSYGFVDLPAMDADKLKKKLNGSILKGKTMRVEDARAPTEATPVEELAEDSSGAQGKAAPTKSKKSRKKNGVLPGLELPEQRRVKRGWTDHNVKETIAKKRRKEDPKSQPSKYTQKDEVLFRVNVPPNKLPLNKDNGKPKKKKDNKKAVVHEFSNSSKQPSFLRSSGDASGKKVTKKYVDEKGWVDEDSTTKEPKQNESAESHITSEEDAQVAGEDLTSSSKEEVSSPDDETSSDGSSSKGTEEHQDEVDEDSSDGEESPGEPESEENIPDTANDTTSQPALTSEPESKEQHPLEALFKRPKSKPAVKPSLEVNTAFTFFDPDEDETIPPHTPFTILDRRDRNLRSAAPTPDTPAPGTTTFSARQLGTRLTNQAAESNYHQDKATPGKSSTNRQDDGSQDKEGKPEESEFAKWFWEHRGETNRTWKRRRREAAKEERQRENRKRAGK